MVLSLLMLLLTPGCESVATYNPFDSQETRVAEQSDA